MQSIKTVRAVVRILSLFAGIFFALETSANAQSLVRRPILSAAGSSHGCPCPYDQLVLGNGSVMRCGNLSSWSRPGGWEPTCYASDYMRQIMSGGDITDWVDVLTNCYADPMVCRVQ